MLKEKIVTYSLPPVYGVTKEDARIKRLSEYRRTLIDALPALLKKRKLERHNAKVARIVAEVRRIAREIGPVRH